MKKKNPFLRILAGLVGGILGYALISNMYEAGRSKSRLDAGLAYAANKMNQKLPMMADSETRIDKVLAGPGKKLTYLVTLPNQKKSQIDLATLQKSVRQNSINNYRTNQSMDELRAQNIELDLKYFDSAGESIFETVVTPKDF